MIHNRYHTPSACDEYSRGPLDLDGAVAPDLIGKRRLVQPPPHRGRVENLKIYYFVPVHVWFISRAWSSLVEVEGVEGSRICPIIRQIWILPFKYCLRCFDIL